MNFDIAYEASEFVHFAAGAEVRNEGFTIEQGQNESWQFGPYAPQGFSAACNGFPRVSARSRSAAGIAATRLFTPTSSCPTWKTVLSWEAHSDSNDSQTSATRFNWKTAARAELTESFAVRASASTGFRAPRPGQQNAFNVSTQFDPTTGELVNRGTIPSNSKVAALRGGQGLQPETSMNFHSGRDRGSRDFSL